MSTETPSRRRGVAVLEVPLLNKGTAFSATERDELGFHGLVPPVVETLEQQAVRACETLGRYVTTSPGTSTCDGCRTRARLGL
jgi:hypothetical protein